VKIACPRCGVAVPGADIDLGARNAVCRPCGEVFPFPTSAAYKPTSLDWRDRSCEGEYVALSAPRRILALPLLFFVLVWDGFLAFWYVGVVRMAMTGGAIALIAGIFPIVHLLIGLWMTHHVITLLFNTTRVTIDRTTFRVRRGPIPQRGVSLPTDAIEGFGACEVRGRRGSSTYRVDVRTSDKRTMKALAFDEQSEAAYVAEKLGEELVRVRRAPGDAPYR
jgi:hypothetical protein